MSIRAAVLVVSLLPLVIPHLLLSPPLSRETLYVIMWKAKEVCSCDKKRAREGFSGLSVLNQVKVEKRG